MHHLHHQPEAAVVPAAEQDPIDAACDFIRNRRHGYKKSGDYLLDMIYGGDLDRYRARPRTRPATVAKIADRLGAKPKMLWDMIRVAVQLRELEGVPTLSQLTWTQHRELLPVEDVEIKRNLADLAALGRWTVAQLREARRLTNTKNARMRKWHTADPLEMECLGPAQEATAMAAEEALLALAAESWDDASRGIRRATRGALRKVAETEARWWSVDVLMAWSRLGEHLLMRRGSRPPVSPREMADVWTRISTITELAEWRRQCRLRREG